MRPRQRIGIDANEGEPGSAAAPRPASALTALLGAMFLGNVDVAIANIAAPSIRASMRASGAELQLIVAGYTLAYAALLVTGARLGQARGYRQMFLAGLGGFIAASLACGLAPNAVALIIARIAAGGAAAVMAAQVLTGIQLGFTGRARARALGLYSLALSAGAVAGQSLGGLLVSADVLGTSWRPAFLLNVPVGVVLIWLARRSLPSGRRQPQQFDLAGVAVSFAAVLLLVVPLIFGHDAGWPAWTWVCLAASIPAFAGLWHVERRVQDAGGRPLIDPRLVARPAIGWGLASQAATTATYFAVLFTLALYLQQGLGRSAAYSGLALLSWVVAVGIPGPVLGRCPAVVRTLAAPAGAVLLAAGFAGLAVSLYAGDTGPLPLMTLLGVAGLGLGTTFTATLSHLISAAPAGHAADVSGLFNSTTRLGGVIGTAAFGAVYLALVHSPEQAARGFGAINLILAATALVAAAFAGLSVRRQHTTDRSA